MKTLLFSVLSVLTILCFSFVLKAQSDTVNTVYLSKYSFKVNANSFIGKVVDKSTGIHKLKLSGKQAFLFRLKGGEIQLTRKGVAYYKNNNRAEVSIQILDPAKKVLMENDFIILKDEFVRNKTIAHRGAWKNTGHPQNSIASLNAAIQLGVAGSEFDIHLTADDVLVINHDAEFDGLAIEKSTYAELLRHPMKNGESIPTLEAYITAGMSQQKTLLIAELKSSVISKQRSLLLAEKTMEKVRQLKAQAWMVYISFDYDILKRICQLENTALTMYLNGDVEAPRLKADGIYGANYQYSFFQKHNHWIADAHKAGIAVSSWTVNGVDIMDALLAQDIDYITTDEPEALLKRMPPTQNK